MMSKPGSNLPEFRSVQLDFAAHIRNPQVNPLPADVEPRRMKIYTDLFFNNVRNFLDSAFPVSREILGDAAWGDLAREFFHSHASESPYFLQISEEFLTFLHDRGLQGLPPFLLELCHYEWVEMALDVAPDVTSDEQTGTVDQSVLSDAELLGGLAISSLVRPLTYSYPVHELGVENQLQAPPEHPSFLLVYRNAECDVRFVESNPVTHRLLELLMTMTAATALEQIRGELNESGRNVSDEQMQQQGLATLRHLHDLGIILGSKLQSG